MLSKEILKKVYDCSDKKAEEMVDFLAMSTLMTDRDFYRRFSEESVMPVSEAMHIILEKKEDDNT